MLSTLILLPLIGSAFIGFYPFAITAKLSRIIALVFSVIIFLWSIFLGFQFNPGEIGQQFAESLPWVDAIGLNYNLGIDGLSLPLLILNGLLTCIAIYSTDESQQRSEILLFSNSAFKCWGNWSIFGTGFIIILPVL